MTRNKKIHDTADKLGRATLLTYVLIVTLMLCECSKAQAQVKFDSCFEVQQTCDAYVKEAEEVINLQQQGIEMLVTYNSELDQALRKSSVELSELKNPVWYKDSKYMFILGLLVGVVSKK